MSDKKNIRVIISGGGTGGHVFPAISIANALKKIDSSIEILFVGALGKIEMEKVPAAGYEIVGLDIRGLQRRIAIENFLFPWRVLKSMIKSNSILRSFKPLVAVGVGGFASGPLLYVASLRGIPCLIQEQNSYAGITNKLLAKRAKKIAVAFEGMENYFPKSKLILTGNPVRSDILELSGKRDEAFDHFKLDKNKKTVLLIGGSLGARTLNESILFKIDRLVKHDVQVIWQTGKTYYESTSKNVGRVLSKNFRVMEFITRMDLAYAAADIIISRAGAGTISELCLAKKPVILVPSPNVAEDHQTKNAMALVEKHAAILIRDEIAKSELVGVMLDLLKNEEKMQLLSENIGKLAIRDSAERIAKEVLKLV